MVINFDILERLHDILGRQLTLWELQYGKGADENTLSGRFSGIIRRASEQAGCGVVVLIDEYDKPLCKPLTVMMSCWKSIVQP